MQLNYFVRVGLFSLVLPLSHPLTAASVEGWEKIPMAGDTKCADGSPYSIYVNRGTSSRIVFDFLSGGACWSAETCQEGFDGYTGRVPDMIGKWLPMYGGIYDRTHNNNPFKNDTHVIVPYCTGDIHWGAKDTTYIKKNPNPLDPKIEEKVTIYHRGAINAKAAIEFSFTHLSANPENIFVTGCSAGSYGSIWWTPYIKRQMPSANIVQFGDSGAGIVTDQFRKLGPLVWNINEHAPHWIRGLEGDMSQKSISEVYAAIGRHHRDLLLTQHNFLSDIVQRWFFKGMGGNQTLWSSLMRLSMLEIDTNLTPYSYYISPGSGHCTLLNDEIYDPEFSGPLGQPFFDWFDNVQNGDVPASEPCIGCLEDASLKNSR